MFLSLFCAILSLVFLVLLILVAVSYRKDWSVPFLGAFSKRRYQKARFKIWDDLEAMKKKGVFSRFRKICFRIHKFETSFFQLMTILFESERNAFLFLNCDEEAGKCDESAFPGFREIKKKVSFLSILGLTVLVLINVLVGFVFSQLIAKTWFNN